MLRVLPVGLVHRSAAAVRCSAFIKWTVCTHLMIPVIMTAPLCSQLLTIAGIYYYTGYGVDPWLRAAVVDLCEPFSLRVLAWRACSAAHSRALNKRRRRSVDGSKIRPNVRLERAGRQRAHAAGAGRLLLWLVRSSAATNKQTPWNCRTSFLPLIVGAERAPANADWVEFYSTSGDDDDDGQSLSHDS